MDRDLVKNDLLGIKSDLDDKSLERFDILVILKGWRHGQVVRQRTANPLPPVRIWVPPFSVRSQNIDRSVCREH